MLCRRHHRLKHAADGKRTLDPAGAMSWTSRRRQITTQPWHCTDPTHHPTSSGGGARTTSSRCLRGPLRPRVVSLHRTGDAHASGAVSELVLGRTGRYPRRFEGPFVRGTIDEEPHLADARAPSLSGCRYWCGDCARRLLVGGQGADPQRAEPGPAAPLPAQSTRIPEASEPTVQRSEIVAVGDIACDPANPVFDNPEYCRHEEVAQFTERLVAQGADWFMPLGDIQYESGTLDAFNSVYDRWFGRFRSITKPIAGNQSGTPTAPLATSGISGNKQRTPEASEPLQPGAGVAHLSARLQLRECRWLRPGLAPGSMVHQRAEQSGEQCAIAAWPRPLHPSGEYNGDQATEDRATLLEAGRRRWRGRGTQRARPHLRAARPDRRDDPVHGGNRWQGVLRGRQPKRIEAGSASTTGSAPFA